MGTPAQSKFAAGVSGDEQPRQIDVGNRRETTGGGGLGVRQEGQSRGGGVRGAGNLAERTRFRKCDRDSAITQDITSAEHAEEEQRGE